MKISVFSAQMEKYLPLLRCPLCGESFACQNGQLRCSTGHCFDLSSKGYVNLAPQHDQSREKYDAALFESRSRIFAGGFYAPLWDFIARRVEEHFPRGGFSAADIGCGEGYYTRMLTSRFPGSLCFGLDLSRDGIQRAARHRDACWMVADLKKLPFAPQSMDVLLDILTPADYASFARVLKPGGIMLKVIPGSGYLEEIRSLLKDRLRNPDYDNTRVLEHLSAHGEILSRDTVRKTFPLSAENAQDFLRMTPMTFSLPEKDLQGLSLSQITIHMELLTVRLA